MAPQALFFLNDPLAIDQARAVARRVALDSPGAGPEAQVRSAYRLVFGRAPTGEELAVGGALLQRAGNGDLLERYCQLLLSSNEFFYVD